jgi:hypothetical protein
LISLEKPDLEKDLEKHFEYQTRLENSKRENEEPQSLIISQKSKLTAKNVSQDHLIESLPNEFLEAQQITETENRSLSAQLLKEQQNKKIRNKKKSNLELILKIQKSILKQISRNILRLQGETWQ